jgi:hypothetical protein
MAVTSTCSEAILCPISGRQCKQCAVYRGRHFQLCASNNTDLKKVRAEKASAWTDHPSTVWEMPTIRDGARVIADPENFVERRDTSIDPM